MYYLNITLHINYTYHLKFYNNFYNSLVKTKPYINFSIDLIAST